MATVLYCVLKLEHVWNSSNGGWMKKYYLA